MYLIQLPNGLTLFYGLDSGRYLPKTMEALRHHRIDLFISEASVGVRDTIHPNHLNLQNVCELTTQLYRQGTLHPGSHVYLTHISHGSSHTQMLDRTEKLPFPVPVTVAWDGLKILTSDM